MPRVPVVVFLCWRVAQSAQKKGLGLWKKKPCIVFRRWLHWRAKFEFPAIDAQKIFLYNNVISFYGLIDYHNCYPTRKFSLMGSGSFWFFCFDRRTIFLFVVFEVVEKSFKVDFHIIRFRVACGSPSPLIFGRHNISFRGRFSKILSLYTLLSSSSLPEMIPFHCVVWTRGIFHAEVTRGHRTGKRSCRSRWA